MNRPPPSYRDLYYSWERHQWSAGEIDLGEDRRQWKELDADLKSFVLRVVASAYLLAERSTGSLVPLVDAAPTEEQQIFLTTQLVDAARHAVFFDLVADQVLRFEAADMSARVAFGTQFVEERIRTLIQEDLSVAGEKLLRAPQNAGFFTAGVTLFHLTIESSIVAEQTRLLTMLEERQALPGLVQGLTRVLRDCSRHLDFARRYLAEQKDGTTTAR